MFGALYVVQTHVPLYIGCYVKTVFVAHIIFMSSRSCFELRKKDKNTARCYKIAFTGIFCKTLY